MSKSKSTPTTKTVPLTAEEEALLDAADANARSGKLRKDSPKKAAKASKRSKPAAKPNTAKRGAPKGQHTPKPDKPMSLLDAAVAILQAASAAGMRCKDIVEQAAKRGLWTPGAGKTPANTLYSSILREIATKGKDSRFIKADRGKFALAKK